MSIWKTNQDELRDQMRNSKNLFMVKFILGVWSRLMEKPWVQGVPSKSSVYYLSIVIFFPKGNQYAI